VRVHVWTAPPAFIRSRQLEANFVFEHMRRRVELDVHGPPQGHPHRRAVRRRRCFIMHPFSLPSVEGRNQLPKLGRHDLPVFANDGLQIEIAAADVRKKMSAAMPISGPSMRRRL